jgi:hypothetical protein
MYGERGAGDRVAKQVYTAEAQHVMGSSRWARYHWDPFARATVKTKRKRKGGGGEERAGADAVAGVARKTDGDRHR